MCRNLVYGPNEGQNKGENHILFTHKKNSPTYLGFEDSRMKWLELVVESGLLIQEMGQFGSVTHDDIMKWLENEYKNPIQ